ncbi:hypothetical protein GCM10019059_44810 [Camelimonas fluminis]|uniref:Endonuclease n=1 Tax=Camelimonas fluminis TaxID=1576911 RepID=A0ABV7UBJ9_9HYPH|nr:hypothetical protein [Camelimonas fluminis]GHE82197.1 hypothetical protein GCM10019059_44810 [Camelimonas fluminis]
MKVHFYTCDTAPAHRRVMGLIETVEDVAATAERGAHKRQTFLPITCFGATEAAARQKADDFWQGKLDNETRRKERTRALAARAKGGADGQ